MAMSSKVPFTWPPPKPRDLPWELAVRMGVSAGLGLFVAHVLDLEFPVYVLLSVATVASISAGSSWLLAGYRLVGTLVGLPFAILVAEHSSVTPLSAGLVMGAIVLICAGIGSRDATRLAALVFAVGVIEFSDDVTTWAKGRLVATIVGAAVTFVVCAVPLPHRLGPRHPHEPDVPRGFIVGQE